MAPIHPACISMAANVAARHATSFQRPPRPYHRTKQHTESIKKNAIHASRSRMPDRQTVAGINATTETAIIRHLRGISIIRNAQQDNSTVPNDIKTFRNCAANRP